MSAIQSICSTQKVIYGFTHEQVQKACNELNEAQIGVRLVAYTYELRGLRPVVVTTISEDQMPCSIPQEIIEATSKDRKRNLWVVIYRNGQNVFNYPARLLLKDYHHDRSYRFPKMQYGCNWKPTLEISKELNCN